MCGIVGYIGDKKVTDVLVDGLKKLEYRGYDSAGVALLNDGELLLNRTMGKLISLQELLQKQPMDGQVGIGHTRWATHGKPSEENAHPHVSGSVALVHNGIIENHNELKAELIEKGHTFLSETDTEVVVHLIDENIQNGMEFQLAFREAVKRLEGAYALCVITSSDPSRMMVARKASPLILGLGEGENFVASDVPAVIQHTKRMVFLKDMDVAEVTRDGVTVMDLEGNPIKRGYRTIAWDPISAEKGGHKHFMHKEIHEQPQSIINVLANRISLERGEVQFEDFHLPDDFFRGVERITIVACGTAYHASLVGKLMLEGMCRIHVETDLGSEYRYRDPMVGENDLLIVVSQSGETADTLAAVDEFHSKGGKVLGIVNSIESSIARKAEAVIYTHAGPEIGVASTKAFTTQIMAFFLLAIYISQVRQTLDLKMRRRLLGETVKLPVQIQEILGKEEQIRSLARQFRNMRGYIFLGRGFNYPIALEGALKLKEISYLHAEGFPAGELKHGPIALVDEEMLTVALCQRLPTYEKMLSNIEEVRARDGKILAIAEWDDELIGDKVDHVFTLPAVTDYLKPILSVIPLQLFAYHVADIKGTDVDQPRNLAKSVTVE